MGEGRREEVGSRLVWMWRRFESMSKNDSSILSLSRSVASHGLETLIECACEGEDGESLCVIGRSSCRDFCEKEASFRYDVVRAFITY